MRLGERPEIGAPVPARLAATALALSYPARLGLIVLGAGLLRLALLAAQPLGYDEDFTAAAVHRPFADMLGVVSRDSSPPLFYLIERLIVPAEAPPWSLRLVSAIGGTVLVALLAALGRRIGGDRAGLWTAALVAFLPATVLASENARMYALAGMLVVAATLLLWRAIEAPSVARWTGWTALAAAALWTDYFSAPALLGVLLALAVLRPPRRRFLEAALGLAIAGLSLGPWLVVARAQLGHAGAGFWVPPLDPVSAAGTLLQLFAGPPLADGRVDGSLRAVLVGCQVLAIAVGAAALGAWAARVRSLAAPVRRAALFALVAGTAGVGLLVLASVWRPLLEARYASVMWLPLFALAGAGLAGLPAPGRVAFVGLLAAASVTLGVVVSRPDTAAVLPAVEAELGEHDLVAAGAPQYLVLLDEGSPRLAARLHVLADGDLPWYFGTAAYAPGAVIHTIPPEVVAARGRILYVAEAGRGLRPVGYREASRTCAGGVCLTVYSPR